MNYEDRDTYGIYKTNLLRDAGSEEQGPDPDLMGADTLIGNEFITIMKKTWEILRKSCWMFATVE
ncbi:hypothetical protein [Pseudomonas frederiksbergensis]|uniref:hypothetical protein n=1 Tax=Pseudomonas frederiksbergensis TaxID=104087 RepID=UPI0021823F70|nr:hypothetical protein [Pseudomonas frederiksbergensis]